MVCFCFLLDFIWFVVDEFCCFNSLSVFYEKARTSFAQNETGASNSKDKRRIRTTQAYLQVYVCMYKCVYACMSIYKSAMGFSDPAGMINAVDINTY